MKEGLRGLLPRSWVGPGEQRVHMDADGADVLLGKAIYQFGLTALAGTDGLVLLCIGTDRSIGDALGPLIGSQVSEAAGEAYTVMGTLDDPVHAGNLSEAVARIQRQFERPFVLAVDACLGRVESVGMLTAGRGSLKPGAGVNKSLPAVGDVYVTGVVNVGGFMEYFVLQNTRLSLVVRMSRVAARAIGRGLSMLAGAQHRLHSPGY